MPCLDLCTELFGDFVATGVHARFLRIAVNKPSDNDSEQALDSVLRDISREASRETLSLSSTALIGAALQQAPRSHKRKRGGKQGRDLAEAILKMTEERRASRCQKGPKEEAIGTI